MVDAAAQTTSKQLGGARSRGRIELSLYLRSWSPLAATAVLLGVYLGFCGLGVWVLTLG